MCISWALCQCKSVNFISFSLLILLILPSFSPSPSFLSSFLLIALVRGGRHRPRPRSSTESQVPDPCRWWYPDPRILSDTRSRPPRLPVGAGISRIALTWSLALTNVLICSRALFSSFEARAITHNKQDDVVQKNLRPPTVPIRVSYDRDQRSNIRLHLGYCKDQSIDQRSMFGLRWLVWWLEHIYRNSICLLLRAMSTLFLTLTRPVGWRGSMGNEDYCNPESKTDLNISKCRIASWLISASAPLTATCTAPPRTSCSMRYTVGLRYCENNQNLASYDASESWRSNELGN